MQQKGFVYVLRFKSKLGNLDNPRAQAQHYVGWAEDVQARLAEHRAGRGAKITAAAAGRGIEIEVVYVMPGTRHDERRVKNYHNTARWLRQQGVTL